MSVFAPCPEQTSYGWGKGYEITNVPCPHSCMSSGHDVVYKDSNQLVLADSELGYKHKMGSFSPGLMAAPSGRHCSASQTSHKCMHNMPSEFNKKKLKGDKVIFRIQFTGCTG